MIEPGLAEGGNWIPTPALMRGIRDLCDKNEWLMIADEALTGLGRTGRMWGVEHYDVIPDLLVVGKNLSGGTEPCAGVAARVAEHSVRGAAAKGPPRGGWNRVLFFLFSNSCLNI